MKPRSINAVAGRRVRRRLRRGHVGDARRRTCTTARPARRSLLVGGDRLDPDGHVSQTDGVQDTNMTWQFDERAGAQELRPFGYLAFRYLEVDGTGETLTADDVQIDARHASMPDEHAARFDTSNATLNAVWNLARHSALFDSQEQFLDTPTAREGRVPRRRFRRVAGDDGRLRRTASHVPGAARLRAFAGALLARARGA